METVRARHGVAATAVIASVAAAGCGTTGMQTGTFARASGFVSACHLVSQRQARHVLPRARPAKGQAGGDKGCSYVGPQHRANRVTVDIFANRGSIARSQVKKFRRKPTNHRVGHVGAAAAYDPDSQTLVARRGNLTVTITVYGLIDNPKRALHIAKGFAHEAFS